MSKKKPDKHSPFAKLGELKEKLAREQPTSAPAPAKQKPTPAKRAAEATDTLSFARLMSGVDKLEDEGKHRVPRNGPDPGRDFRSQKLETFRSKEEVELEAAREQLRALAMGGVRFEVTDDGVHVEGRRLDVTPALLRRLRRGEFPIDARLDLHGFTAEQAKGQLEQFLAKMRARGEMMVLVVHGKGEHSPGGIGILRGEIGAWLSQGSAAEHTAAFATARTHDGGEGAMYVLLRRR